MKAKISNIQRFCIHDGPGIRTTVFFQGCLMHCWWCHNPESIIYDDENVERFYSEYTPDQLLKEIKKDMIFYDESGGGVTFSGGEPLLQAKFLKIILKLCKSAGIHTTLDTAGFCNKIYFKEISELIDLYLYDLKIINDELHKKYTGVSNKLILQNLKYISENNKNINIRIPLIPEITNTKSNLMDIKKFLSSLNKKHKINLLPYHKMATGKYKKFNIENRMKNIKPNNKTEIEIIKNEFVLDGFDVKIGG